MIWLCLGVVLWAYSHMMKRVTPGFRAGLGVRGRGVATILSFVALALMIYGYRRADVVPLWAPPDFMRHLNNLLMLVAVILVNLGFSRGVMRTWLRHPMLTSVMLWAVAHLLVNGDLASVILFGGIGLWAFADRLMINRMEPVWERPVAGPWRNDLIYLAASGIFLVAVIHVHAWLGYPPVG